MARVKNGSRTPAQQYGGVKPVNGIQDIQLMIVGFPMTMQ
jgi:hypothetical protein